MAYEELGAPDTFLFQAAVELGYKDNMLSATETEINWKEGFSLTEEQQTALTAKAQELRTAYNNANYQRTRASAYPAISDQLDMLYHAIDSDETLKTQFADFYTAIKQVKDNNPKS